jgi:Flp pilus assembly protein TadD
MRLRVAIRSTGWALLVAAAVATSCAQGEPPPRTDAERAARAQALIESGNDAYRAGDYRLAARRYAAAAVVRKDDAAAYFGMGMALSKLGRHEEAHAAYERSRELAQKR